MYNSNTIFVATSFTEVEDASGEPHTVNIGTSDQTKDDQCRLCHGLKHIV